MKYIDLFAGVGGFRYGIENTERRVDNIKHNRLKKNIQQSGNFTCVYSNEWDKYANSVYKYHWKECDERDITTVKTNEIPDHDLFCAGFPCQAFSVAGKRLGFEDTRGTLFFEIARIARDKRPRYLLLENVKGLLSHDKGKTFQTILGVLSDLGYRVQWQVLNSKHFGVPQNRERVIIIGHLGEGGGRKVFPITGTDGEDEVVEVRPEAEQQVSPTITTPTGGHHMPTIDANYYKGINTNPGHASSTRGIQEGTKIRRLTPVECERLQGFPDNWTKYGHDGKEMSDTQRYKMMGNAVTTNVISAVIQRMIDEN